ncbi:hypothetical protein [Paracoccus litorisediminis]|uniref:Uncharacterized protein n=1 Tax=Paracoccus litorisediminis TaxID=2006130 RepID=A0A844HUN1_9RHOB|nr:hypothetical protein [Paracoccus litorisediminis]MTH61212.1 hypothetical protein [Paracoccus litorisediminis]
MNLVYTVFSLSTGAYIKTLHVPDLHSVEINTGMGEVALDGDYPETSYLRGDEIKVAPEPPSPAHVFDYDEEVWVDPRSLEDILQALRSGVVLSRVNFLMACVRVGVLSQSEALIGAKGELPPSIVNVISSLPSEEAFEIQLRWAALTEVDRLDPLILVLASAMQLSAETLDDIFGIHTQ